MLHLEALDLNLTPLAIGGEGGDVGRYLSRRRISERPLLPNPSVAIT